MKLLDISADSLSLEFATYEREEVMKRLAACGSVEIQRDATYERIRVDDIELIYVDEWGEPCLISSTTAGNDLLRAVVENTVRLPDGIAKARPPVSIPKWLHRKAR